MKWFTLFLICPNELNVNEMKLLVTDCGTTEYATLWEKQQKLLDARVEGRIGDVLLLTEHTNVYTLGKSADPNHLVANEQYLASHEIDVVATDRGGDITYHGPGQLVVYPIISLENFGKDIHLYLRNLEQAIIEMLETYGVASRHDDQYTGVWVGEKKIASIGIKVRKWVTMHGAAINISTDLSYFDGIIACGIFHRGITSLSREIVESISPEVVRDKFVQSFCSVFTYEPEYVSFDLLMSMLHEKKEIAFA